MSKTFIHSHIVLSAALKEIGRVRATGDQQALELAKEVYSKAVMVRRVEGWRPGVQMGPPLRKDRIPKKHVAEKSAKRKAEDEIEQECIAHARGDYKPNRAELRKKKTTQRKRKARSKARASS